MSEEVSRRGVRLEAFVQNSGEDVECFKCRHAVAIGPQGRFILSKTLLQQTRALAEDVQSVQLARLDLLSLPVRAGSGPVLVLGFI